MVLGDLGVYAFPGQHLQLLRHLQAADPILLLLVDLAQPFQGALAVNPHLDKLAEHALRPIEQSRAHIVLPELVQGIAALLLAEIRARDQILVDADRPVDLSAAPKRLPSAKCVSAVSPSTSASFKKTSMALSGCSLSR